jgi:hypothetical protein
LDGGVVIVEVVDADVVEEIGMFESEVDVNWISRIEVETTVLWSRVDGL